MIAITIVVLTCVAALAVAAWLLRPRARHVTAARHAQALTQRPIETIRFKPTPSTDTVYIPRVSAGQNKHYVDLTAEMPKITKDMLNGRHA